MNPDAGGYNVLNGILSIIMLVLGAVILVASIMKWINLSKTPQAQLVKQSEEELMRTM